jgi:hypothetical protein
VSFGRGFLVYGGSGGQQKFSKLLSEVVSKQISANNKKNPATRVKSGSSLNLCVSVKLAAQFTETLINLVLRAIFAKKVIY